LEGLLVYRGKAFPEWEGHIFSGALVLEHLNHIGLKDGLVIFEKRYLEKLGFRIRNVIEGPKGELIVSTDNGKLLKIYP